MKKILFSMFGILTFSVLLYGRFSSKELTDEMTDEVTVMFVAFSDEAGSVGDKPGIYLTSTKDYVSLTIDFENMDYMNNKHVLEYRFDKEPMAKIDSSGSKMASFPFIIEPKKDDKDFKIFLDNLLKHETLIVRTKTFTDKSVTATFDITGLKDEIAKRNLKGTVLEEYIDKK